MIQPGMMFGGEGPVMQGTWYNPHTGDAFTVRDSFFEDNQYTVTTTDGRYLRYDQIQNYIQSDMKLEDLKKSKPTVAAEVIPSEVSNLIDTDEEMILPEDAELLQPKLGNIHATPNVSVPQVKHYDIPSTPVNMNNAIIEKALKNTDKPDFTIAVKWDKYPSKEIEMLKDIMDIPEDEIVEWYLDNIQLNDFILAFKEAIKERLFMGDKLPEDASVKVLGCVKCEAPVHEDKVEGTTEQTKQKTEKPARARSTDKKDKKTSKK